jgi:hypothetical protein
MSFNSTLELGGVSRTYLFNDLVDSRVGVLKVLGKHLYSDQPIALCKLLRCD